MNRIVFFWNNFKRILHILFPLLEVELRLRLGKPPAPDDVSTDGYAGDLRNSTRDQFRLVVTSLPKLPLVQGDGNETIRLQTRRLYRSAQLPS